MRARVTIGALLVVALALVVVGVAIVTLVRDGMVRNVETTATAQARSVATLAEAGSLPPLLEVDSLDRTLLQVVAPDGTVRAASSQLTGLGPITGRIAVPEQSGAWTIRLALPDAEPRDFRVVGLRTETPSGPVTTYAASSLADVNGALASLTSLMLAGLAVALGVIGAVTWLVVGRALRPVEAIRSEVERISSSDLGRRAPVPTSGDEITRLATTMNQMLDRLEQAVEQQRQLVADVSHEIRNPIASLRAQLEVALEHPELEDWPELATTLFEDTERLQALATDLLLLARLDAGERVEVRDVDLGALARGVIDRQAAPRVPPDLVCDGAVVVQGNRAQLAQILDNLLANAQRHARTSIRVAVWSGSGPQASAAGNDAAARGDSAAYGLLEVRNDGPPVPAVDRERIFRRFVRLDDARTRDAGGTGLGLPIAREIARAHGGDLTIVDAGDESRFLLALPLGAAPQAH